MGNITVRGQTVSIVDKTTNPGDGINSGIVGLGYPGLTSAQPCSYPPPNDTFLLDKLPYDQVFTRMYKQGSTDPWFTLDRLPRSTTTGPGGYVGLGVLPPVNHSSAFVKAPVEVTEAIPLTLTNGTREITE
jgi:hypothetical protein